MATPFGLPAELAELQDDYDVLGELGRGGAAVVYRACDRTLGRDVAVKVVHPRPTSPDDDPVARLAREARTVAQLQHANIVAVYAVRRLRGGGLALVMQYVPGETLKTLIQRDGPLPPERCERVLRDVAHALAYAHARGVVHRDVKPENIFLDELSGSALLADFGIARSSDADSMTMTGTAVGTPFYMSPEQVDGAVIDGRSDVYSLGLVAWEMLTGRRPWDGESLYNVIFKQKHEELPPIEVYRAGVPPRLQYVVERMLQKQPAARWAGAEGLLAQLGHAVLPGDYKRWQRSLQTRIERHRRDADEVERLRGVAAPAVEAEPAVATTQHFARPDTGPIAVPPGAPEVASAPDDEATELDALAAYRGRSGMLPLPSPGMTVDLRMPAPEVDAALSVAPIYADVVEPVWESEDRAESGARPVHRRRAVRLGAVAVGVTAVMVASVVALGGERGGAPANDAMAAASAPAASPAAAAPAAARPALVSDAPPPGAAAITATTLSAGGRHSCAVTPGSALRCWGANDRGQLGDGTAAAQLVPHAVAGVLSFVGVSSGLAHTCALTRGGDVYCWGSNVRGQLGDATGVQRTAPVRVAGPASYVALATGAAHSCAVTTERSLRCWGANDQGQLGDGTRAARSVPGRANVEAVVAGVAAGGQHSCIRTDDGGVSCWGANADGQLGDGRRGPGRGEAARVALAGRAETLAAGLAHTCAALASGEVWCWGRNESGQLGTGSRVGSAIPARALLPAGVRAAGLVAGAAHTCALDARGGAWCWGRNTRGALGDSTTTSRAIPVRVLLATPAVAIAAGTGHTCATSAAGEATCWGDNGDGQLGDGTRRARSTAAAVRSVPLPSSPATLALRR